MNSIAVLTIETNLNVTVRLNKHVGIYFEN